MTLQLRAFYDAEGAIASTIGGDLWLRLSRPGFSRPHLTSNLGTFVRSAKLPVSRAYSWPPSADRGDGPKGSFAAATRRSLARITGR